PSCGTSPWVWIAGLLGLLILVGVGFAAFQLLSRTNAGPGTAVEQVTVPNFVGISIDQAQAQADQLGITLVKIFQASDQPANTVLSQDVGPGTRIDKGGRVSLTIASGAATATVPDLRNLTESAAIQAI